jgi:hypothetical protein
MPAGSINNTAEDICNIALHKLKFAEITTLQDSFDNNGNSVAEACWRYYEDCRRDLLALREFQFSEKRKKLDLRYDNTDDEAEHSDDIFPRNYGFELPEDFIKERYFSDSNGAVLLGEGRPYIVGQLIASNEKEIWLAYTADIEDIGVFPQLFKTALATYIAKCLCGEFVGSDVKEARLDQEWRQALGALSISEPPASRRAVRDLRAPFGVFA